MTSFIRAAATAATVTDPVAVRRLSSRLAGTPSRPVHLAGRIAGVVSRELNINRCQLHRLSGSAHRSLSTELLQLFLGSSPTHLQRRPDRAGRDSVHSNPFRRKLLG